MADATTGGDDDAGDAMADGGDGAGGESDGSPGQGGVGSQFHAADFGEFGRAVDDLARGSRELIAAAQGLAHLRTLYVVKD